MHSSHPPSREHRAWVSLSSNGNKSETTKQRCLVLAVLKFDFIMFGDASVGGIIEPGERWRGGLRPTGWGTLELPGRAKRRGGWSLRSAFGGPKKPELGMVWSTLLYKYSKFIVFECSDMYVLSFVFEVIFETCSLPTWRVARTPLWGQAIPGRQGQRIAGGFSDLWRKKWQL